ncbi:hypothetical protein NUACC21_42420 [Scytonema sp. NUACC21]
MFGFIKNLIAGILNFFIGLFGGKKGGYYLELDEAAEVAQDVAKQAASKTKEVAQSVATKTKEATETATSTIKQATKTATSNGKKASEPAGTETQNGTRSAAAPAEPKPAKVELVQTANGVKPEPVSPAKAEAAKKAIQQQPADTTFAPKYLSVPNNANGRRRPGANMNPFLDMARQVKTSK